MSSPQPEVFKEHVAGKDVADIDQTVARFVDGGWELIVRRSLDCGVDLFFTRDWKPRVALKLFPPGITTKVLVVQRPYPELFKSYAKMQKWELHNAEEDDESEGYLVYGWSETKIYRFLDDWELYRAGYSRAVEIESKIHD